MFKLIFVKLLFNLFFNFHQANIIMNPIKLSHNSYSFNFPKEYISKNVTTSK